jgi:hypothetical protein
MWMTHKRQQVAPPFAQGFLISLSSVSNGSYHLAFNLARSFSSSGLSDDSINCTIALFIDANNVSHQAADYIMNDINRRGRVKLGRVYGDFSSRSLWAWGRGARELLLYA